MYTLAYVINQEQPIPTEGFNLSNCSFPDVNGDYTDIGGDNAYQIYLQLVSEGKINSNVTNFTESPEQLYSNGKCYIIYGGMGTLVIPISGDYTNNWYYSGGGGGAELLSRYYEDEEGRSLWDYNVSPGTTSNPQRSQDWSQNTFPTITSYDGMPY